jgi:hypothetical protein
VSLAGAFRAQAGACAALGSPFMARVLGLMAEGLRPEGPLGARLFAWPGDMSARGDAVPLRLAAGLHALVLSGREAELAAVWPAPEGLSDAALWGAVAAALARHEGWLSGWLDRAPQTNEVARSAAIIAAAHWLGGRLVVSELGASAGLNLLFDRWRLETAAGALGPADAPVRLAPRWEGAMPADGGVAVTERAGVDLHPRDPVADRLRLLAYVWADQTERLARMAAALEVAARARPEVARGDAVDWLEGRLAVRRPGVTHLVMHTVAWQYFPAAAQARGAALLAAAGAQADAAAPLAHLSMEADGTRDGAALVLTLWPPGESFVLGRVDFHGRWLRWTAPLARAPRAARSGE